MDIKSAKLYELTLPLKKPFVHGSNTRFENDTLILELSDGQHSGWGEILVRSYVTGETASGAKERIREYLKQLPQSFNSISDIQKYLETIEPADSRNMAALCAMDMALLDLYGKQNNQSVSQLLFGPNRREVRVTSAPMGLDTPNWKGKLYSSLGINDIKLKITPDTDPERIRKIRTGFPRPKSLRLDANESFSSLDALTSFIAQIKTPVTCIEQPVSKELDVSEYNDINNPLMADESIITLEDAKKLNGYQYANIRLGKNGGILRSREIIKEWAKRGKSYMLGSLVGETSLLSAATLHLASGIYPNPIVMESCYCKRILKTDPTNVHPTIKPFGKVSFDYNRPGLGVELDLKETKPRSIEQLL